MSENWLVVFPTDPGWVPTDEQAARAADIVQTLVGRPGALRQTPNIEFVHAGGNFEAIRCPSCGQELADAWWQDQMDAQYSSDTGFDLQPIATPCCASTTTLNDLAYEWPLGFARWQVTVPDPNRGWLSDEELRSIGQALGHPVRHTLGHL